ncbi:MMPL family transporter [Nocardia sp. NPDC050793]|uniref:MMPL family transporter n=1 Tax=Nocardia sp. NPDC050793 TaxID=3155159 RepID=UPI0033F6D67E
MAGGPIYGSVSRAIADFVFHRRKLVLVVWGLLLILGALGGATLHDRLSIGGWVSPDSESTRAAEELAEGYLGRGATSAILVVQDRQYSASDAEFAARAAEVLRFAHNDSTLRVRDSIGYSTLSGQPQAAFLGKDRDTTLNVIGSDLTIDEALKAMPILQSTMESEFSGKSLAVRVVSTQAVWGEANLQTQSGLVKAELITAPLILLVLLWLFRGVVAAVLAVTVGVTAIVFTTGTLGILSHELELSIFVENIATMLGLGVGIDYSLIMLKRFEEELTAGRAVREAVLATVARAGHAVVASGVTVIAALASLLLIDLNAITSMAVGGMMVIAFAILATAVLLPTLLCVLGPRVLAGRIGPLRRTGVLPLEETVWYRFSRFVMRRPVVFLVAGVTVFLACAAPAVGMKLFIPDARVISADSAPREGTERIIEQFGAGVATPIQVVVRTEAPIAESPDRRLIAQRIAELRTLPHVVAVNSPLLVLGIADQHDPLALLAPEQRSRVPGDAAQIVDFYAARDGRSILAEVITDVRSASSESVDVLRAVRGNLADLPASVDVMVGGETAGGVDTNTIIEDGLPSVVLTMLAAIALVLFLSFRSLVLPVKAIALNLLSLGAMFGILTAIFQRGWGAAILPFEVNGYVVNFVPVILLAVILSLNTDYEVFLLTRVRESFLRTGDNVASVAEGAARTGPLISGAAILMISVFAAFGLAGIIPIQQIGIGAAIAIALDATLVRLVLVPAAMRLMGKWNWWSPFGSQGGSGRPAEVAAVEERQPDPVS